MASTKSNTIQIREPFWPPWERIFDDYDDLIASNAANNDLIKIIIYSFYLIILNPNKTRQSLE